MSNQKFANPVRVLGARELLVVSGTPDQQMAAVAAAQRGRVTRRQLKTIGMTHQMIRTRLDRDNLHVLHRAVFAVGHPGRIELGDETAAVLAYGDNSALSHRSAVWVWGFTRQDPEEVHLILHSGSTGKSRPGIHLHRSKTVTAKDITIHKGLPVAKPALALLQLAEFGDERELELALDEALAVRAVSRTKLREVLAVHGRGRRGAPYLAELLDSGRPSSVTRSQGEERLRDLILTSGLPTPQMQTPLYGFTADFYWPQAAYVIEFDGYAFHNTRRAFQQDRTKDRTYKANRLQLDRFTWEDITTRPIPTIAHITRQITERTLMRSQSRSAT